MEREEVEVILKELGWVNTLKKDVNPENDSEYIIWINSQDITIYIGNWFIESELWSHAYPYKDKDSNRVQLVKYLKGIKHDL